MNSDVHFIFATDGQVNAYRSSFPYGEVGTTDIVSNNGSRRGSARSGLGYSGTVFEPIDEFKGDMARAALYVATRYENIIAAWENNSSSSDAVLNGGNTQVFETWYINLLKQWHQQDPVSQKEIDRNEAAHVYQGNRNPFVDHPEYVQSIWGN
jgi:endonuclease I